MVSMLASGTQDRGFDPGRSRRIFSGEKIYSMPSLGGSKAVKEPWVYVEVEILARNSVFR